MSLSRSDAGDPRSEETRLRGVVLIEGVSGVDLSAHARRLEANLAARGVPVLYWPPAHPRHPVAFENVSLVSHAVLAHVRERDPDAWHELRARSERYPDGWIVRHTDQLDVPDEIADRVRRLDAYVGDVTADAHARAVVESWRRFGARTPMTEVHVWEGVLLRSSHRALIARFALSPDDLGRHVRALLAAVHAHRPVVVYLDDDVEADGAGRGGPDPVTTRRQQERDLFLELLPTLGVPTIAVAVAGEEPDAVGRRIAGFVDGALRG